MKVEYVSLRSNKIEDSDDSEQLNILNSIKKVSIETPNEPSRKKPKLDWDMKRNCDTSVAYICKVSHNPTEIIKC